MSVIDKDVDVSVRWSTAERVQALKRIVSKKSIEKACLQPSSKHRHCRRLPRWFVVWFVIALALFCRDSYQQVFRWLHRFRPLGTPGRSTLCEARKSVGVAPLRRLAEAVIELLAQPDTPRTHYAGLRLMALDSFVVDVPDTPANERGFGRPQSGRAPGAFPQARVLSLCEIGTHVLWRSLLKPHRRGEVPMARYLMRFLQEKMLLLWDRNFLSYDLVSSVLARKAHLLARIKKNLIFTPIKQLGDGSYLAKLYPSPRHRDRDEDGIVVRIIEYTFDDPGRPGSGQKHRLLTTLLSASRHPAVRLIELYHERWEEELAIDEFKTHQRERPVLRSETPAGVVQEIYGLLLGHFVIRKLASEAATTIGCPPREISFVNTLKILRCRLPEAPRNRASLAQWYAFLVAEVAEQRLPPRRDRINPRVIKRKKSNWAKKTAKHRDSPQPTKKFRQSIVILN
jgi:hypothetical protein